MNYSQLEKNHILQNFPKLELSYEKKAHKKVFKDICLAIPKGQKYFAWFTILKGEPICLFLQRDIRTGNITKISSHPCCFDEVLCNNTIVYGSQIYFKQNRFFYVEDIYYYQDQNLNHKNFKIKMQYLDEFFRHIRQVSYNSQFIVFGMVPFAETFKKLSTLLQENYVEIHHIQHRSLYQLGPILTTTYHENQERDLIRTFKVVAETQNDIYSLYAYDKGKNEESQYDNAYVSDYKNSVFLNKLFRKIKENQNLDALEESDSEGEFENIEEDKYVLHKTHIMDCKYIKKFKKWEPFRISKRKELVTFQDLKNI
jgi:hypothetical protein